MKKSAHLTPGEFELMEILWPLTEATVKEVWQRVDPNRNLAYTTVMTVLEKMYRKGILSQRKRGKAYVYSAILTRDDAVRGILEHICGAYFGGSASELVSAVNRHSSTIGIAPVPEPPHGGQKTSAELTAAQKPDPGGKPD